MGSISWHMTEISLHTAAERKETKVPTSGNSWGNQRLPTPMSFSISEQDSLTPVPFWTQTLRDKPYFGITKWTLALPTGLTHCQTLKCWIVEITPNDFLKIIEIRPQIQIPEREVTQHLPVLKETMMPGISMVPWMMFAENIMVIIQSHQKISLEKPGFFWTWEKSYINLTFDSYPLPHTSCTRAAGTDQCLCNEESPGKESDPTHKSGLYFAQRKGSLRAFSLWPWPSASWSALTRFLCWSMCRSSVFCDIHS